PRRRLAGAGFASVSVLQPNDSSSAPATFAISPPSITSLSPPSAPAGSGPLTLNILGSNFAPGSTQTVTAAAPQPQVQFGTTLLPAVFVNSGSLTVQIPGSLLTTPATIPVTVINPGGSTSNSANFTVTNSLTIVSTSLPGGTQGAAYTAHVAASGGYGAYTWSASGLPGGLSITASTGDISG